MAMTNYECRHDHVMSLLERLPPEEILEVLTLLNVGADALEILGRMDLDLTDLDEYHKNQAKSLVAEWDTRLKPDI